jgi:hypothetical protein
MSITIDNDIRIYDRMSLSIIIDIFIALVCRYQPHIYDRMSLSIVIDIFIALVCRYLTY